MFTATIDNAHLQSTIPLKYGPCFAEIYTIFAAQNRVAEK